MVCSTNTNWPRSDPSAGVSNEQSIRWRGVAYADGAPLHARLNSIQIGTRRTYAGLSSLRSLARLAANRVLGTHTDTYDHTLNAAVAVNGLVVVARRELVDVLPRAFGSQLRVAADGHVLVWIVGVVDADDDARVAGQMLRLQPLDGGVEEDAFAVPVDPDRRQVLPAVLLERGDEGRSSSPGRMRPAPRSALRSSSLLAQRPEEAADLVDEELRLFEGGEVPAAVVAGPVADVVGALAPGAGRVAFGHEFVGE
jgi:hypothetical protein